MDLGTDIMLYIDLAFQSSSLQDCSIFIICNTFASQNYTVQSQVKVQGSISCNSNIKDPDEILPDTPFVFNKWQENCISALFIASKILAKFRKTSEMWNSMKRNGKSLKFQKQCHLNPWKQKQGMTFTKNNIFKTGAWLLKEIIPLNFLPNRA